MPLIQRFEQCQQAGKRPLAEQSDGEFAPAIPTTGARDAAFPTNAKSTEVRLRPRLGVQPFQLGAQPLLKSQLQEEPRRRSRRVAPTRRGIRDRLTDRSETGSNPSDSTLLCGRSCRSLRGLRFGLTTMSDYLWGAQRIVRSRLNEDFRSVGIAFFVGTAVNQPKS